MTSLVIIRGTIALNSFKTVQTSTDYVLCDLENYTAEMQIDQKKDVINLIYPKTNRN